MNHQARELTADELTFVCDPSQFPFKTTDELPNLLTVIGQERAVRAIDFGVQIPSYGFNIYVMGPAGTGRSTTVQKFLQRKAQQEPVPDDWVYVHNFVDPRRPRALCLPAGRGKQLRDEMAEFIRDLQEAIPTAFDSEDYNQRAGAIAQESDRARSEILKKLEAQVTQRGFALVQTAVGLAIAPVVDGQVLTPEQYQALGDDVKSKFEAGFPELRHELDHSMREVRALGKAARVKLRDLARQVADVVVGNTIHDLEANYAAFPEVVEYLKEVRRDTVEHLADFRPEPEAPAAEEADPPPPVPSPAPESPAVPLSRYQVNVVVDHSRSQGAPLVYETNPTYFNLVGHIEQEVRYGVLSTDFTHIRAGALHRANGGYLVTNARDLLEAPLAWDAMKRAVKNQEIRIESVAEALPAGMTTSLEPECIPFKAKVILIGDWDTYSLLFDMDDDFRKIFKVRADFGSVMDRTPEAMQQYAQFVGLRVRADGLLPFDQGAVARIVEVGVQLAEHKEKLSTQFAVVSEIIQEASYWAGGNGQALVTGADVARTIAERRYRAGHLQERMTQRILEDTIHIQTEGSAVGQVNGLSVIEVADFEFGIPSRISAQTYMGRGGVMAIDREANLTGNIHNKGLLTLQGYLGGKYAHRKPLSLSASVTFEQNYERIEGDSASCAELYALLSSLSQVPIRQDLAVTGSVDQQGHVQAIGGAVAKIEGFFDICKARGLTGRHGVVIPASNVRHLTVREDVIEAVRQGQFHIYAVETVDEGIQLLTGVVAGAMDAEGNYPPETVNHKVHQRLLEMAEEKSAKDEEEEDEDPELSAPKGSLSDWDTAEEEEEGEDG